MRIIAFDAGTIEARLTLDRTAFQQGLERAKEEARQLNDVAIRIDLDTAAATAKLDQLKARLDDLDRRVVRPRIDIDTAATDAHLADLVERLDRLDRFRATPSIDLQGYSQALTQIAILQQRLDALSRSNANIGTNVNGGVGGGGSNGRFGPGIIGLIGVGAVAAIPVVATLTAGVAGLSGALVAAGAGTALFAGAAKTALDGVTEAVKNYGKQGEAALAGLDEGQKRVAHGLIDLKSGWEQAVNAIRPQIYTAAQHAIAGVSNVLSAMRPVMVNAADAFKRFSEGFERATRGATFRGFADLLARQVGPAIDAFGKIFGNLGATLAHVLEALEPLFRPVEDAMVRFTDNLRRASEGLKTNDGFQKFMQYLRDNGPLVAKTLHDLWDAFTALVAALAPLGPPLLALADSLAKLIKSVSDNTVFREFVKFLADALSGLAKALDTDWGRLGAVAFGLGLIAKVAFSNPWIAGMTALILTLGWLHDHNLDGVAAGLIGVSVGIYAVSAAFGALGISAGAGALARGGAAGGVIGLFAWFVTAKWDMIVHNFHSLSEALSNVGHWFSRLNDIGENSGFGKWMDRMHDRFWDFIHGIGDGISKLNRWIGDSPFGQYMDKIRDKVKEAPGYWGQWAQNVGHWIGNVGQLISRFGHNVGQWFGPDLVSALGKAGSAVGHFFAGLGSSIGHFFADIGSKVGHWASNIWGSIRKAFTGGIGGGGGGGGMFSGLTDGFKRGFDGLFRIWDNFSHKLGDAVRGLGPKLGRALNLGSLTSSIGHFASGAAGAIGRFASNALGAIGRFASGAMGAIGNWASGALGAVGRFASGAVGSIGNFASNALGSIGRFASGAIGAIGNFAGSALGAIGGFVGNGLGAIGNFVGGALGAIGGFVSRALGMIGGWVGSAVGLIGSLAGRAVGALSGFASQMMSVGINAMGGLWRGLQSVANSIMSWVQNFASSVSNIFRSVLSISSPSKVFHSHGANIMEGLRLGMESGSHGVLATARGIAGELAGVDMAMGTGTVAGSRSRVRGGTTYILNGVGPDVDRKLREMERRREFALGV